MELSDKKCTGTDGNGDHDSEIIPVLGTGESKNSKSMPSETNEKNFKKLRKLSSFTVTFLFF